MVSIPFEKLTLSNGLDVILHVDHSIPLVAVNVWYHVGFKDEEVGRTGLAHLFEHMMFEGSGHHNHSHFDPLQKAGANLNGSTTPDRTNYWEDIPRGNIPSPPGNRQPVYAGSPDRGCARRYWGHVLDGPLIAIAWTGP